MWCWRWFDPRRLPVFTALALGVLPAPGFDAANSAVTALVSCPIVPPGGTAQIAVTLPAPVAFTHGHFRIDLDPAVFGAISAVNVFSASGDQQGVAALNGVHADVRQALPPGPTSGC